MMTLPFGQGHVRGLGRGLLVVASLALCLSAAPAEAALFTLVDANSSADFDTTSQSGNYNWFINGQDIQTQQWFWYRVGNVAEQSIDTLPIGVQGVTDTDFDGDDDTLFVRYLGGTFQIDLRFSLAGGAPGSIASDLAEQITITNTGQTPLDFHFFQYNDYDLNGTAGGDSVVFTNNNAVQQFEGLLEIAETVISPVPSHRELAFFPLTRNKLNDGVATNLNDLPATGVVLGPGDVTWAYQWDFLIPAGGSRTISKDKNVVQPVPEPASWVLMAMGAAMIGWRARRVRGTKRA